MDVFDSVVSRARHRSDSMGVWTSDGKARLRACFLRPVATNDPSGVRRAVSVVLRGIGAAVGWWAAGSVVLAGCATGGLESLTKDTPAAAKADAAKARAEAKWAAIVRGDLDSAYSFLSPASRSIVTAEAFKSQLRRPFRSATVDKVECEAELCTVKMTVTYDHRLMKNIPTPLEESWVIEQGQIWCVMRL